MKPNYREQYRQIGLKIAYYRKLRGLTQEELAEQVGVTPAFIGHLEVPNIARALSLGTPLISPPYWRHLRTNFYALRSHDTAIIAY